MLLTSKLCPLAVESSDKGEVLQTKWTLEFQYSCSGAVSDSLSVMFRNILYCPASVLQPDNPPPGMNEALLQRGQQRASFPERLPCCEWFSSSAVKLRWNRNTTVQDKPPVNIPLSSHFNALKLETHKSMNGPALKSIERILQFDWNQWFANMILIWEFPDQILTITIYFYG